MLQQAVNILLVDDDHSLRNMLSFVLGKEGYQVDEAVSGLDALKKLKGRKYDLVISDIRMPDLNGIELLKKIKTHEQDLPVIMITAYAATHDAIEAMKLGAEDYIMKPFNLEELKIIISKSLHKKSIEKENVELKQKLSDKVNFENIVGSDPKMGKIFELINTVAQTDSTILISGESGTGKELIARDLHARSPRSAEPFVAVNLGALPEALAESELFGHEKGAFTGADARRTGLFELAGSGTLFLDEIGEMPLGLQVKLLRVLQERKIRRLGGNRDFPVEARIVAATNRDLEAAVADGRFREDLFYRLDVVRIRAPALREHPEDIPLIAGAILARIRSRSGGAERRLNENALAALAAYDFPGNVRELENLLERAAILGTSESICAADLGLVAPKRIAASASAEAAPHQARTAPLTRAPAQASATAQAPVSAHASDQASATASSAAIGAAAGADIGNPSLEKLEREAIVRALEKWKGNRTKAALELGIARRTIIYKIKSYGIGYTEI